MMSTNLWLAHVAKDFFPLWKERLKFTDERKITDVGHHFCLVQFPSPPNENTLSQSLFSRYWMPVDYMWPTKISEKGFIEKCAQGIAKKFAQSEFHHVVVFSLDRKQKILASNLRGRLLQILPNVAQPSQQGKNLVVALSEKCVWAGLCSFSVAGSIFGGGRHYVAVSSEDVASRAAAKFVEAAEFLKLKQIFLDEEKKWLELGAAPGGITQELVRRNKEVWAVDKADLNPEVLKNSMVHFYQMDARDFKTRTLFDGVFCDLNGPPRLAAQICSEKTAFLKKRGIVIYTFKIHSLPEFEEDFKYIVTLFERQNNVFLVGRHLYNNKQEVTLFFQKNP